MNQCVQKKAPNNPQLLLHHWNELLKKQPQLRIRNAAKLLNVSEAELLATGCGQSVIRLTPIWTTLLHDFESLGTVMALTRNNYAVHEQTGIYNLVKNNSHKMAVFKGTIEARLNLFHCQFAFAVEQETPAGLRYSLQFFDATGTAVHKVYLTPASHKPGYDKLISRFRTNTQSQTLGVTLPVPLAENRDVKVDSQVLRTYWRNFKHIHDFEKMLDKFQLTRFEAIDIAGSEFVTPIDSHLFRSVIEKITEIKIPIMLFVSNPGAVQIHCGVIHNLKMTGPWLNILDEHFNLHLDETAISSLYVVEKPITTGMLSSLELYDAQGNTIALIFGQYSLESGEDLVWRDLLMSLPENRVAA